MTYLEILEQFDEPIRGQIDANVIIAGFRTMQDYLSKEELVTCAFIWVDSPEGFDYWEAIAYGSFKELPRCKCCGAILKS